jgi:hypothetical protein
VYYRHRIFVSVRYAVTLGLLPVGAAGFLARFILRSPFFGVRTESDQQEVSSGTHRAG